MLAQVMYGELAGEALVEVQAKLAEGKDVGAYVYEVGVAEVGDHVVCPRSWVPGSEPRVGTVIAMGAGDYDGPVSRATRVRA